MKKYIIGLAVVLIIAAGMIATVQAQNDTGYDSGMKMDRSKGMDKSMDMFSDLNLTPEQRAKMTTIQDDCMKSTQAWRDQLNEKNAEITKMWMMSNPSISAIKSAYNEMDSIKAEIRNSMIDHAFKSMEVLTPEQQMDFRAMMRKNPGMAMHMSMGMGMGYKMKTDKMGMMMKGEGKCPMCDKSMSGQMRYMRFMS